MYNPFINYSVDDATAVATKHAADETQYSGHNLTNNNSTLLGSNPVTGCPGNTSTIQGYQFPEQLDTQLTRDVYRHQAYTWDAITEDNNRARNTYILNKAKYENDLQRRILEHQQKMEQDEKKHIRNVAELEKRVNASIMKDYDKADIDVKVYEDADANLVARIKYYATGMTRKRTIAEGVIIKTYKYVCDETGAFSPVYELTFERNSSLSRIRFLAEEFTVPNLIKKLEESNLGFSFHERFKVQVGYALKAFLLRHCEIKTLSAYNGWNIGSCGIIFVPFDADSMKKKYSEEADL